MLATKSHRDSYRGTLIPETKTKILVCNAGSSSLKFSLFDAEDEVLLADGSVDWLTKPARLVFRGANQPEIREELKLEKHADAVARILDNLQAGASAALQGPEDLRAVGHRVVHGGDRYTSAVRISPEVKRTIKELTELAPLHNPPSLDGINAIEQILPKVPQIAAFDTAFHATLSEAARTYPLPRKWTREWGIRRYGFHGLSHSYCSTEASKIIGRRDLRLVIAHLGNGASVSAVRDGVCVDTSMGFTPLEGLMMATRSGTVDPGLLIYLLRHKGLDAEELDSVLNSESGLLGVSGISSDLRQILSELPHNSDARLAVDVYIHRVVKTIGAMAATLGGIDALVFTAGVGEGSPEIRKRVCEKLKYLGLELDPATNETCKPDADIATPASKARILVIATREDLTIMRETRRLVASPMTQHSQANSARPLIDR
ncbi:MAG TPA: acetate kinase [Candidatus Dormibacteraeota bacterium]|nr:acetate kinase [Candidatus Dormibacteraeota bacterium]